MRGPFLKGAVARQAALSALWICLLGAAALAQAPTVSNVVASQRPDGTGIVDIYYDLSGWDGPVTVYIALSLDNGANWNNTPNAAFLTGDVGPGVISCPRKHIAWDAASERPGLYSTNARLKVIANGPSGIPESVLSLPGGVLLTTVRITSGTLVMGSIDRGATSAEVPLHTVTLNYNFWMGRCEVTQKQWVAVMGSNPSSGYGIGDDFPVHNVNYNMIAGPGGFLVKLNQYLQDTGQTGQPLRLPSEAEWEYACRAETQTRFYFGDSLSVGDTNEDGPAGVLPGSRTDYMWYSWVQTSTAQPVGRKLPNQFGLYDMHGNIWEWCQDYAHDDYTGAPTDGSAWLNPTSGKRVLRGGSWGTNAYACTAGFRVFDPPDNNYFTFGFRLARTEG